MWGLPLLFEEPKLMGFLLPPCKGLASSSPVFAISLCIQCLIWTASPFFFFSPSFLVTVLHQKHMLWQWPPSSPCCTACLSWCGSGSSVAIYWLRSCSVPVLLLKGTGCSCLSHSQTFPFPCLPWLLHSLMVNQVPSSDQIYHRTTK